MTAYIMVGVLLWLAFNVGFVWLRLRAADMKERGGLQKQPRYSFHA